MSTRPRRHPLDPERPAIPPSGPRGTLPPRPSVPYDNNDTWRAPHGRQHQSPGGYRDDRRHPTEPSYSDTGAPAPYRSDSYVPQASHGNYNARAGPSWQPTETYRPPPRQALFAAQPSRPMTSSRSPPPHSGAYVPLHLRTPLVDPRLPTQYSNAPLLPTHFAESRRSPAPAFEIPLPDEEYMELSAPFIAHEEEDPIALASKLLVLDLNGTLIYRNKNGSNSRVSYPRPYLGCFFRYIYRPLAGESTPRPWEVFVWSSAQPHNVRTMLESTFDPEHIKGLWKDKLNEDELDLEEDEKILGVWARDKMGLSDQEYAHKTQTTKDLRKVEAHFESDTGFKRFPLETILLLDDSPLKAVYQPWNQLVLPEYDRDAYHASHRAVDDNRPTEGAECDEILLAVIGILETTSSCENIPAWIRAGGLKKPDIHFEADRTSEDPTWFGAPDGPAAGTPPTLASLPTHGSFTHWFQDDKLVARWVQKGKQALKLYGIPLEHGLGIPSPSARSSPVPHSSRQSKRNGTNPPGHTVPAERRRGWSPSRPSTDLLDDMSNLSVSVSPQPEQAYRNGSSHRLDMTRTGPTTGQSRSYTTTRHESQGIADGLWRTFRSVDVSIWLADLSERSSLNEQERDIINSASRLVHNLDTRERQAMCTEAGGVDLRARGKELVVDPFLAADITNDFFNSTSANGPGFSDAERTDRQKHVAARAKGIAVSKAPAGPKDEHQRNTEVVTKTIRDSNRDISRQTETNNDIIDIPDDELYQPDEQLEDDYIPEEPEPVNAQYPLDHPTSTFDLSSFLLRGNALSKIEIARYFARAAGNKDPIQQQLLRDLLDWEDKHRKASEKIGTDKPPHPQMIGSSLRHMDKLRQKIIGNEDIRDMKNARIAERRKEIQHYRDRGLVPPPPRKAPNYRQQRPKEKKRPKAEREAQHKKDRQTHKAKLQKRKDIKAAAEPSHVASGPQGRAARSVAGPSLVSTPASSHRARAEPAIKAEIQTRSQSSKRRASNASSGAPAKAQRVN